MKNKDTITRKVVYLIMLLGVLLSGFGGNSISFAYSPKTYEHDVTINTGNYQIPSELLESLKIKLVEIDGQTGNATAYGVVYYEEHPNWTWINIAVANGEHYNIDEIGPMFLFFAANLENNWVTVLSTNNSEYLTVLDQVNRNLLTIDEINLLHDYYLLNRQDDIHALAGNLLLPWPNTQNNWTVGSLGFHSAGFTSLGVETNAEAVDLIPPSSLSNASVLAMESGAIVNKLECTWNTVLIVRHDGYPDSKKFVYLHIQNGTSPGIGSITRGKDLGTLRQPVMNGTCYGTSCEIDYNPATGNVCSQSTARHLHLGFGTDRSIVIDGKVVSTLSPGMSLSSSNNTSGGGGTNNCEVTGGIGIRLYDGVNCTGSEKYFSSTGFTNMPDVSFNDMASSINVGDGWSVRVYEHDNRGGSSRCIAGDMWDLSKDYYTSGNTGKVINNDISSIDVYNNTSCATTGTSWNAKYFSGHDHWWDNNNFNNKMCEQNFSGTYLDRNYGSGSPCGNSTTDNWVAEYNATINFPSGSYVFYAQNDDGLKIWVNGSNIMERGGSSGYYPRCPALNLSGNVPIKAILREEGGDARVKITWSTDTSVCIPPNNFNKLSPTNNTTGISTNPTLTWESSQYATSYHYCIDTSNNNNCDTGWQNVGTVTNKALSGLTAGTTYYWQVRANNEGGEKFGNNGTWWAFTTQPNVPSIPQNLRVNGSTTNSITLAWDDVSNETGYKIYQWEGDLGFVYLATVGANQTTYTETRANCGWDEYYTVSAYNGNGESDQSGWIQGFTQDCPVTPPPPLLSSPANASTHPHNYDLTFQWNSSSGATQYLIEWWGGPYATMQPCGWSSSTSCNIGVVTPGHTYSWRVKARNASGESAWSNTWTFTIQSAPPAVFNKTSPSNGATGQSTSPTLNWGTSIGATSYEYCYDTTNDNTCSNWTSNGTSTSKALSGLSAGTTYYWQVRAVNSGGMTYSDSSTTAFWSFNTAANPPGAFNKSSPSNGATNQSTSPILSWGTSSGATSYEYCYDTTNDNTCSNWVSNGISTSKTLEGLSEGTTYYWHVRAINSGGTTYANGNSTVFWSFTTQSPQPPSPTTLLGASKGAYTDRVWVTWLSSIGATRYEVWRNTSNVSSSASRIADNVTNSGTVSEYNDTTATPGTIYYYWTKSCNNYGCSDFSGSDYGYRAVSNPICYSLTRNHTGTGSTPTASPSNSTGCPSGQYTAGQSITMTAYPASGYSVGSWSGTSNNSSTSTSNTVTMPAGDHTVTANYVANANVDAYEPDNDSTQAKWIYSGSPQVHSIVPATDVDWVKFTLSSTSAIRLETSGDSASDTRMWLYDSSLSEIEYDDDDGNGFYSLIERVCGSNALPAGTYYVKIDEFGNNDEIPAYTINFDVTQTCADAPTFADVPFNHSAWQYIEAIYNAGITGGCTTTPLNYCPNNTVTRAQMAIFLLRGIHGSSYTPPAVGDDTGFNDVPTTHSAAAWIKQLAAEGITGGCGGGNYCPNQAVTRAQMAIFLLRAKYGDDYVPPAVGGSSGFNDVPAGSSTAPWIKQLAAEGITGGCGNGNYCPNQAVTRAQMAIFLQRTFNLPLP